ncbi:MAG: hypothetical protein H8E59_11835 [Actinobacteria bacterium]|nr:hypothetical protein [Actinomycetota bacterium]
MTITYPTPPRLRRIALLLAIATLAGACGSDAQDYRHSPLDSPDQVGVVVPDGPSIGAGRAHSCAILDTGDLKCWGKGGHGLLGISSPVDVGDGPDEMGDGLPQVDLGVDDAGARRRAHAVSTGGYHTCVILDDGYLVCFGEGGYGQLGNGRPSRIGDQPEELGNALIPVDLGAGPDGTPRVPGSVSAGDRHTCALTRGGEVLCWGEGRHGQLGNGSNQNVGRAAGQMGDDLVPVDLGTSPDGTPRLATSVSAGYRHSCALISDGAVACWGNGGQGELGNGRNRLIGDEPGEMGDDLVLADLGSNPDGTRRRAVAMDVGLRRTCVVIEGGEVTCWGLGTQGLLGNGRQTLYIGDHPDEMGDALTPVDMGSDADGTPRLAIDVAVGGGATCVVLDGGELTCWGVGNSGMLGNERRDNVGDVPGETGALVDLGTGRSALAVSVGDEHVCATLDDATLKCWGRGSNGRTGLGSAGWVGRAPGHMGDNLLPVDLGTGRSVRPPAQDPAPVELEEVDEGVGPVPVDHLTADGYTTCYRDKGKVRCWGMGYYGALANGTWKSHGGRAGQVGDDLPAVDLGLDPEGRSRIAMAVANGFAHSCAVLEEGEVACWGLNHRGQLGLGHRNNIGDQPEEIGDALRTVDLGGRPAVAVTAGYSHTCALLQGGQVVCWGDGGQGRLGTGARATLGDQPGELGLDLIPIDLGREADGEPLEAIQIVAGHYHTCALLDMGRVVCWGNSGWGQIGVGGPRTIGDEVGEMGAVLDSVHLADQAPVVSVESSLNHTCARFEDGAVTCWGRNNYGQLGLGHADDIGDDPGEMGAGPGSVDLGSHADGGIRMAVDVAVGGSHSCAIDDTGSVLCWGRNHKGQLGVGHTKPVGDHPGEMGRGLETVDLGTHADGTLRRAVSVAAGYAHTCVELDDATVTCWGHGGYGQTGRGSFSTVGDQPGEMGDDLLPVL